MKDGFIRYLPALLVLLTAPAVVALDASLSPTVCRVLVGSAILWHVIFKRQIERQVAEGIEEEGFLEHVLSLAFLGAGALLMWAVFMAAPSTPHRALVTIIAAVTAGLTMLESERRLMRRARSRAV